MQCTRFMIGHKVKVGGKTKTMKENIKENKKTNTKAQNDLSLLFKYRICRIVDFNDSRMANRN